MLLCCAFAFHSNPIYIPFGYHQTMNSFCCYCNTKARNNDVACLLSAQKNLPPTLLPRFKRFVLRLSLASSHDRVTASACPGLDGYQLQLVTHSWLVTAPNYQQFIFESVKETRSDETMPERQQQQKKTNAETIKNISTRTIEWLSELEDRRPEHILSSTDKGCTNTCCSGSGYRYILQHIVWVFFRNVSLHQDLWFIFKSFLR